MNAREALELADKIRKEYAKTGHSRDAQPDWYALADWGKDLADFLAELSEDECKALLNRIRGD